MTYSIADIPSQSGKLAVITGATGGLGYETALALAGAGATVILTGRNTTKAATALANIRNLHPKADISYDTLDLSSLASVADFSARFLVAHERLDILVNNAGVMAPPERQTTTDGFEMQFGTNYLGHFALTAQLLPALSRAHGRVVTLSSIAARRGAINFDDLQFASGYTAMKVYSQSKLACLMFARELQRRSDLDGYGIISLAAHPGVSSTDLIENGMGRDSLASKVKSVAGGLFFQSPAEGALPTLFAATSPRAVPAGYYGPDGFMEVRGKPTDATPPARALDVANGIRLWEASERLTHTLFPRLRTAA